MDSFSSRQLSTSMPSTNRLGSKAGLETKASTSPLRGSMATSAPRRSPKSCSTMACSLMSIDSTSVLPGVAGRLFRRRTARPPAEVSTLLEAGAAVQLGFVGLLQAQLADVLGAPVVGLLFLLPILHRLLLGGVDAADVADQVAAGLAQRVAAEQARLDFHPRKAVTLRDETGHLFIGQPVADGQGLEALAFFELALEAPPVPHLRCRGSGRVSRWSFPDRRPWRG